MKPSMTIMKTLTVIMTVGALLALASETAVAQNGYDLFQQALVKERADGDLQAAIELYQRIVGEHAADHVLAAKALVQLGRAYETLGNTEAQQAYERVLRDYTDQREQVAVARTRLTALTRASTAIAMKPEMTMRRVWVSPVPDLEGSVSPDGRYLFFQDPATGDLAVRDLVAGTNRRVTRNTIDGQHTGGAVLSRDGSRVAYGWRHEPGSMDLRLIGFDGSQSRILFHHEDVVFIDPEAWSPDGEQILARFLRKDRTWQIVMVSVADGSVQALKSPGWWDYPIVQLSPDGRHVAYHFEPREGVKDDIFLLAVDGSREIALVEHPADDEVFGWSADGTRLLFTSDRMGTIDVWMIEIADGKPQRSPQLVRQNIGDVDRRGLSSDGALYYVVQTREHWVMRNFLPPHSSSEAVIQRVWATPDVDMEGQVRDGRHLFFEDQQPGGDLAVRDLVTGKIRRLTNEAFAHPRYDRVIGAAISPDGSRVAYGWRVAPRDSIELRIIGLSDGSQPHIVSHYDDVLYLDPEVWSPDGTQILTKLFRKDVGWEIVMVGVADGSVQVVKSLGRLGGFDEPAPYLSPDGRYIAYDFEPQVGVKDDIFLLAADGSHEIPLVEHPADDKVLGWSPDGTRLLFSSDRMGTIDVWMIEIADGKPQGSPQLVRQNLGDIRLRRGLSSDGVLHYEVRTEELWVMENFLPVLERER